VRADALDNARDTAAVSVYIGLRVYRGPSSCKSAGRCTRGAAPNVVSECYFAMPHCLELYIDEITTGRISGSMFRSNTKQPRLVLAAHDAHISRWSCPYSLNSKFILQCISMMARGRPPCCPQNIANRLKEYNIGSLCGSFGFSSVSHENGYIS
jgi:hypothetical protein